MGWETKQKQNPQRESLIHPTPMLGRQRVVWGQKVLAPTSKGGSWPAQPREDGSPVYLFSPAPSTAGRGFLPFPRPNLKGSSPSDSKPQSSLQSTTGWREFIHSGLPLREITHRNFQITPPFPPQAYIFGALATYRWAWSVAGCGLSRAGSCARARAVCSAPRPAPSAALACRVRRDQGGRRLAASGLLGWAAAVAGGQARVKPWEDGGAGRAGAGRQAVGGTPAL